MMVVTKEIIAIYESNQDLTEFSFIDLDNVLNVNWHLVACFLEERTNIGLLVVLANLTTIKRL